METIRTLIDGYVAFATEDGTRNDNGTIVLIGGAVLITALALFIVYNVVRAILRAVRQTLMGTARGVIAATSAAIRATAPKPRMPAPAAAGGSATIPLPRVASGATKVKVG